MATTFEFDALVWIQTSFLGDVIINTAAFALAKQVFPHAKQIVITNPAAAKAINGQNYLDHVLAWKKKDEGFFSIKHRLAWVLKQQHCQKPLILRAHRSVRSGLLARLIGGPIIGYHESQLAFLNTINVARIACMHEAQRLALLLEPLGVRREWIAKAKPVMNSLEGRVQASEPIQLLIRQRKLCPDTRLVAMAPGSVWPTKRWPIESFIRLIKKLFAYEKKLHVVLIGSENESHLARQIIKALPRDGDRLFNLVGKTSLSDLTFLYEQLDLLISNDSSPVHYASSFNVPTLTVFGATISALGFGPLATGSQVVERSLSTLPCRPCSDHGPLRCPLGHFNCMKQLEPERVFLQAKSMIG